MDQKNEQWPSTTKTSTFTKQSLVVEDCLYKCTLFAAIIDCTVSTFVFKFGEHLYVIVFCVLFAYAICSKIKSEVPL